MLRHPHGPGPMERDPERLDTDTIAALATAPGVGAIAVVRVSGTDARKVLAAVSPAVDGNAHRP